MVTFRRQIYPEPGREEAWERPFQGAGPVGISSWPSWAGPGPASLSLVVSVKAETAVGRSA